MDNSVYIRPLQVTDGLVSYKWRNNPKIWRLTGTRDHRYISAEKEMQWIEDVLKRHNEMRFAVCLSSNDKYIGNVYFTHIKDNRALIHVFIGESEYWGQGKTIRAARQVVEYGFDVLKLETIDAEINQINIPCISLMKALGFKYDSEYFHELHKMNFIRMSYTKEIYEQDKNVPDKTLHINIIG